MTGIDTQIFIGLKKLLGLIRWILMGVCIYIFVYWRA